MKVPEKLPIYQGFPIKTILQSESKKIRHGFYGLSGFTLK
jgi:hypothetical protein